MRRPSSRQLIMEKVDSLTLDPQNGYCTANSIYYSKRNALTYPQDEYLDLPTFISLQSQTHSSYIALIDPSTERCITFSQLWQQIRSLAAGLSKIYVQKGNVVLILSPNSIHFPVICMAIMSIGAVVSTANPLNTAKEIAKQAADSKAVLAFVPPDLADKLADSHLPLVLITSDKTNVKNCIATLSELLLSNPADMPDAKIRQDDVATLLYSSGTTGMSKAVISTHRNLISSVCILLNRLKISGNYETHQTYLCMLPMFHIYGLTTFACGLLASDSTIVVVSKFGLAEMLECIEKYKVTYLPLVPPIVVALTKSGIAKNYDLSSLHTVTSGAAPLSKESSQEFVFRFPQITLKQGYGLTETTGVGSSIDTHEESKCYGSVGLLSSNTEAKIVDPNSGVALPPNQRGELWLRGPFIMKGYLSNPEATSSALEKDGWLHTGDLCYIDGQGYVFIVDRVKELIKYNGYQVAPAELEALLFSHPEIADVAVIPFPDKEAGQIPMAYVVRKQDSTLSQGSVIDFVAKQVAPYKKVCKVVFVNLIPKTAAGKILRKDLIKFASSRL